MTEGQDAVGGEFAVDQLPDHKRCEQGADRQGGAEITDVLAAETQRLLQIQGDDRQIAALDEVLDEHHQAQPRLQSGRARGCVVDDRVRGHEPPPFSGARFPPILTESLCGDNAVAHRGLV